MSESSFATSVSLIERVRRRDSDAWSELVDLYAPLVARWCRQRGFDHADTADLLQVIFLSVSQGLGNFRSRNSFADERNSGSFRSWLWSVARSRIIDRARSTSGKTQPTGGSTNLRSLTELASDGELPDDDPTTATDWNELVHRAMEQIRGTVNPDTWQAFWRCVIDGLSTDVVAAELKMQPATVRQARSRILRRLREQLGDC